MKTMTKSACVLGGTVVVGSGEISQTEGRDQHAGATIHRSDFVSEWTCPASLEGAATVAAVDRVKGTELSTSVVKAYGMSGAHDKATACRRYAA